MNNSTQHTNHQFSIRSRSVRLSLIGIVGLLYILSVGNGSFAQTQTIASATSTLTKTATATGSPSDTPTPLPATEIGTAAVTAAPTLNRSGLPLTLWYGWLGADAQTLQTAIDAYQSTHGKVAITTRLIDLNGMTFSQLSRDLVTAQRAGQSPTILLLPAGWLADLADASLITSIPANSLIVIHPLIAASGWDSTTYNGQVYGIPQSLQCVSLFANDALAQNATITADALIHTPNVAVTFDFYSTAGIFFGLGGKLSQLQALTTLNSNTLPPEFVSYLSALHDWYALTSAGTPAPYPTAVGLPINDTAPTIPLPSDIGFREGLMTYALSGSTAFNDYRIYLRQLNIPTPPTFANGSTLSSLVESQAYAITTHDPQTRAAALDLIATLLAPETQSAIGNNGINLPVNPAANAQLKDPLLQKLAAQCQNGVFPSPDEARTLRQPFLDNAIFQVTVGGQLPAQVASQLANQLIPTLTPTVTLIPTITPVGG